MSESRSSRRPSKRGASTPVRRDATLLPRESVPTWLAAALIVLAGLAAYANSFSGLLVFDDEPAIAQNPNLRRLWPLATALSAPSDTTLSGRPFASLTFAIDYARGGGALGSYHATNLAIHIAAALLLFGVLRRTCRTPRLADRFGAASTALALSVGLLFVTHPLQTGSVTYVVQRVESLMGLLYLATLYAAVRAQERGANDRFWIAISIMACALGMATKEVMVTAPLMVVAWDRLFAVDPPRSRRVLYSGLFATWLVLAFLVAGGHRTSSAGFGFVDWPWWRYLLTQSEVILHYLRLAFFPSPLVLDYDWRPAGSPSDVAGSMILMTLLVAATLWGFAKRSPAAFPALWFLLILAPTSSVLPIVTEVAAEHRMYLPLAGVLVLVVLGAFESRRKLVTFVPHGLAHALPTAGALLVGVICVSSVLMTRSRNEVYQDYDRVWSDTIAKRPDNARARNNYAASLLTQGRFSDAEPHLRAAVQVKPEFVEAQANLGAALAAQGKIDEAVGHLQKAAELKPDFADAHRNLAEAYAMQHRLGEALSHYLRALSLKPDDVRLLNRAGWILATSPDDSTRNGARARELAEQAVRLTSRQDPDSLDTLAAALAESGEFKEAEAVAREASGIANRQGQRALAEDALDRAARYAARTPYREP